MTSSTLLANMVLPAITGLIVGFAAGLIVGATIALRWFTRRATRGVGVPIYHEDTNPASGHRPLHGKEHLSWLGVALAVMGVISLIVGSISLLQIRSVSSCLADYAQASATATQARAGAGDIDRAADAQRWSATQDSVAAITSWFEIPQDLSQEDRQRIIDENKARFTRNRDILEQANKDKARAEEIRAASPLPAQPAC